MLIRSIEVEGFRDLPSFSVDGLGRTVNLAGPTPATTALGDALELFFASTDTAALKRLLERWHLLGDDEEPDFIGEPFPNQASWQEPSVARSLVHNEAHRDLRITVRVSLDPPQFGLLRELAVKEPRLVNALAEGETIEIAVGALFATTFDSMNISINRFAVGEESFALSPVRPAWMDLFLDGMAVRWHRHRRIPDLARHLLDAALSTRRYESYVRWQRELEPHFGLVRVARGPGGRPIVLADDLPLRRYGEPAVRRAEIAASIHLSGGEVLWFEGGDSWVEGAVEGEGSALEQVFRVSEGGELKVTNQQQPRSGVRSVHAPEEVR